MTLQNKPTILIDGSQSELTGNYELVGRLEGTSDKYIVRCTDTNNLYLIELP